MADDLSVGIGELARQVRDVFSRIEGIAQRLESGQFVRTDLYNLYKESIDARIGQLLASIALLTSNKADDLVVKALEARVAQLEDDKKWLVRLVLTFVVLAVLAAAFAASKAGS